ncbi:hypothetical protein DFJ63DRAFT_311043 [Scheffersomyces coipomensis]|uniref:uncharacterized protein n=1 Tax=Scheffersomyces coipomensis TaxID=1788519 RepID=UPI00315C8FF9
MVGLIDIPLSIKREIIQYLPQQSLLNLSLTNYEFYEPCIQQLYKHILIQYDPIVKSNVNERLTDFVDSNQSVIYALNHDLDDGKVFEDHETRLKLINLRLSILIESLKFNTKLIENIQEVSIIGNKFADNIVFLNHIQELVYLFEENQISLDKFFISDHNLRSSFDLSKLNLKTRVIDSSTVVQDIIDVELTEELVVESVPDGPYTSIPLYASSQLTSLILPNDYESYWTFVEKVIYPNPQLLSSLKSFKFYFNYQDITQNIKLITLVNWTKIECLEVWIGGPNNDEDVLSFIKLIPADRCQKIRKLSMVQSFDYSTHKSNEVFDLAIFSFIKSVVSNLHYLSIEHSIPLFGDFEDGFEGNHLRILKLYDSILPGILSSSKYKVDLYLTNFFTSLASYEQSMNTLLWNGCKCSQCHVTLGLIDDFLMYHKYYSIPLKRYRDLNSSNIFNIVATKLSSRMIGKDEVFSNLNLGHYPLRQVSWDFHNLSGLHEIPIKCYSTKLVDHGEFDGEDAINDQSDSYRCKINSYHYLKGVPISISHSLDSLIGTILNLNRGNAEKRFDEDLNEHKTTNYEAEGYEAYILNDGGDSELMRLNINRISINGIIYTLDKELNGTHYFEKCV